ncbi:MAG: MTH938/NDUFAF3 family protein, partial [Candidatus Puniceispirillaceae bacterium]
ASALRDKGVKLEVMSTAAACRTWNVLLTEGRTAAAGLLAVE